METGRIVYWQERQRVPGELLLTFATPLNASIRRLASHNRPRSTDSSASTFPRTLARNTIAPYRPSRYTA